MVSSTELEADKKDLHVFVEQSNRDRVERENEEKRLIREKKEREDKEQALDNEI